MRNTKTDIFSILHTINIEFCETLSYNRKKSRKKGINTKYIKKHFYLRSVHLLVSMMWYIFSIIEHEMSLIYLNAPFQTTYSILTDCKTFISSLKLKYGIYLSDVKNEGDISITVKETLSSYEVTALERTFTVIDPLYEIDRIIFENTKFDQEIFALHGAAVEWDGKAYVFLASTSSGKTTLTSYLCANGFSYITDDCVLLEREHLRIHPYTAPVHLRKDGFDVLKKYKVEPVEYQILHEFPAERYVYTPKNCVLDQLPIGCIFFIERTENENRLSEMSVNNRMSELMKSPITTYKVTTDYLRFISKLAKTNCKKLYYYDMAYVTEIIKNGR